jgi:hypothetical protein
MDHRNTQVDQGTPRQFSFLLVVDERQVGCDCFQSARAQAQPRKNRAPRGVFEGQVKAPIFFLL